MKIVFFGSSTFSIPALKACLAPPHEILMVITTPDRKKGRGLKDSVTPVKEWATGLKLPLISPETLKDPELIARISALNPDLFVVSSYGKFIPSPWLKIPSKLCLNIHPSLLPKYRGAAPINWPILNGDAETGLTIIEVAPKLDAGDIFLSRHFKIPETMNAQELSEVLAEMSFDAVREVFDHIEKGTLARTPQTEEESTYARKLEKEDGQIRWSMTASEIVRRIRGLMPWPTAYVFLPNGEPLQILAGSVISTDKIAAKAGIILSLLKAQGIEVQTAQGSLLLQRVKPAGKKELSAYDFANGQRLTVGIPLGRDD